MVAQSISSTRLKHSNRRFSARLLAIAMPFVCGVPALAEELVVSHQGAQVAAGQVIDFGTIDPGQVVARTFTLTNYGPEEVALAEPVFVDGEAFRLASALPEVLRQGETVSFTIETTGTGTEAETNAAGVGTDGEGALRFKLTRAVSDRVVVTHDGKEIGFGEVVDYGRITAGEKREKSFKLKNNGPGEVRLSGSIAIDGGAFEMSEAPEATVAPGEAVWFSVRTSGEGLGLGASDVTIDYADDAAHPFRFRVRRIVGPLVLRPAALGEKAASSAALPASPGAWQVTALDGSRAEVPQGAFTELPGGRFLVTEQSGELPDGRTLTMRWHRAVGTLSEADGHASPSSALVIELAVDGEETLWLIDAVRAEESLDAAMNDTALLFEAAATLPEAFPSTDFGVSAAGKGGGLPPIFQDGCENPGTLDSCGAEFCSKSQAAVNEWLFQAGVCSVSLLDSLLSCACFIFGGPISLLCSVDCLVSSGVTGVCLASVSESFGSTLEEINVFKDEAECCYCANFTQYEHLCDDCEGVPIRASVTGLMAGEKANVKGECVGGQLPLSRTVTFDGSLAVQTEEIISCPPGSEYRLYVDGRVDAPGVPLSSERNCSPLIGYAGTLPSTPGDPGITKSFDCTCQNAANCPRFRLTGEVEGLGKGESVTLVAAYHGDAFHDYLVSDTLLSDGPIQFFPFAVPGGAVTFVQITGGGENCTVKTHHLGETLNFPPGTEVPIADVCCQGAGLKGVTGGVCSPPSVLVAFDGAFDGIIKVEMNANLPNGSQVTEEILVDTPLAPAAFSTGLPPGSQFNLQVTEQPEPSGTILRDTMCSLPSGTMTMGQSDMLVQGDCESEMVRWPELCDLFPELCIIIPPDPIGGFLCLGGTLVHTIPIISQVCDVVCTGEPPQCTTDCRTETILLQFRSDFLECVFFPGGFGRTPETTVLTKDGDPIELEGPWAAVELPGAVGGQPLSGIEHVIGVVMDPEDGVEGIGFVLDGEMIELDDFQTNLDNGGLCKEWPAENGPCVENSRFSGFLDTRNLTNGTHFLEAVAINNDNPQGFTLLSRAFEVDNDGNGGDPCDTDTTAPTVTLTAPADGSNLPAGVVALTASASDANGVDRVSFLVDGNSVDIDYQAPFTTTWVAPVGPHDLSAKAWDQCGNSAVSEVVTVTVESDDPCDSDAAGPTVTITQPGPGSTLELGNVTIYAAASDPNGVESVQFYADGSLVGVDLMAPYSRTWTPTAAGDYILEARAIDQCGLEGVSMEVPVTILEDPCSGDASGPTVSLTSPQDGAVLAPGTVVLSAGASDPVGVDRVEFFVDGALRSTDTTAPYSYAWNAPAGPHELEVRAWDECGNSSWSSQVTVTVDPCEGDLSGPAVSLTAPADGAELPFGFNLVSATASDPNGVDRVEFLVGGTLESTDTTAPFSYNWNAPLGGHSLRAKAWDQCGNPRLSAAVVVTVESDNPCDADNVPPSVTVTSPTAGTHDAGNLTFTVVATDDNDIESVQLYVDGNLFGVDFSWPYSKVWNAPVGPHSLSATAIDLCGQEGASATVQVNIVEPDPCLGDTTPPTVSITEPGHNTRHEPGSVTIQASAGDANGVDQVRFYIDGVLVATDTTAPYSYPWGDGTIGTYTLKTRAWDNCGNGRWSSEVDVELGPPENPEDPPGL